MSTFVSHILGIRLDIITTLHVLVDEASSSASGEFPEDLTI